jgi:hypothetical protein
MKKKESPTIKKTKDLSRRELEQSYNTLSKKYDILVTSIFQLALRNKHILNHIFKEAGVPFELKELKNLTIPQEYLELELPVV